jgi:hypothetical protein
VVVLVGPVIIVVVVVFFDFGQNIGTCFLYYCVKKSYFYLDIGLVIYFFMHV